MRRVAIGAAGLAVAVLAAAACVLSFDDLRALALQAGARADFAYLYPAAFDALLATALISFLLLGTARPLVRAQAAFVLLLLLAAASWANVSMAMRFSIDARLGAVIVGVVPWLMVLIGLWLLTLIIKHAQVRRAAYDGVGDDRGDGGVRDGGSRDIVPFDGGSDRGGSDGDGSHGDSSHGDSSHGDDSDGSDDDTVERPRPELPRSSVAAPVVSPAESPAAASSSASASSGEEGLGVDHEPPVPAAATQPNPVVTARPVVTPSEARAETSAAAPPAVAPGGPGGEEPPISPGARPPSASADLTVEGRSEGTRETLDSSSGVRAGSSGRGQGDRNSPDEGSSRTDSAKAFPAEPMASVPHSGPGGGADSAAVSASADAETTVTGGRGEAEGASGPARRRSRPTKRPIQWGDLLRRPQGDVLVHPRPGQDIDSDLDDSVLDDVKLASKRGTGRAGGSGATASAPEAQRPEAQARETVDWDPEEIEAGPQETDASSDEAEVGPVETAVPVWPPDAIDTRPDVTAASERPRMDVSTGTAGGTASREDAEQERDTQPYPHLRAERLESVDPAHSAEQADSEEEELVARTSADSGHTVPLAPPSGRMRSTPLPPQD